MWKGPAEDPGGPEGGGPKGPASQQELQDLKDQYEQQQTLIAQLKEMLRKTDPTSINQEKVAEYANFLTNTNARVKRSQEGKDESRSGQSKRAGDSPASEKVMLLRQQLEQNRVKLAERGKSQKGMEDMVTQIKAQFDDSQQFTSQTPLNISLIDDRVDYSPNTNSQELYNILLNKDKRMCDLNEKISRLEANVLDLQENIKEKDSVIDARTKAITLMSENLSKKGKNTLDALDETKEQMREMQENFIRIEEEMKLENSNLKLELEEKKVEISSLKIENERLTISNTDLTEQLVMHNQPSDEVDNTEMLKLQERILELEEVNAKESSESPKSSRRSKKGKQQKQRDNSQTAHDNKLSELEKAVQERELTISQCKKIIEEKQCAINDLQSSIDKLDKEQATKVEDLEKTISELKESIGKLQTEKKAKVVEADVGEESPEVVKLRLQLEENNKNMIKVKANHKSKVKDLNRKIDQFKKIGDLNAAVVKLEAENSKHIQKIAELEEEKGQLQLNMVESKESINLDEVKDLEEKLKEYLEEISTKNNEISTLEQSNQHSTTKIAELTEKIEDLTTLRNAQVKSDLTSVQYEEHLEKLEAEKNEILKEKENLIEENRDLHEKIEAIKKEKQDISAKLDTYMQENIELMDRMEKLSAEKVSSAESIEMVENLTQQEKLELEAYQKSLVSKSAEHLEEHPDLNDSVTQLTEETSELLQKIELFTVERREVMEKMESLSSENSQLSLKLKQIENNRDVLVETYEQLQTEKEELDGKLENLEQVNIDLSAKLAEKSETSFIEEYKSLIEIQKQEIRELKLQLLSQKDLYQDNRDLNEKISTLEIQYTTLLSENEKLKTECDQSDLINKINDFECKIKNNLEDIETYKTIIDENKEELISSSNIINDMQSKLKEKSDEIEHYNDEIKHLNSVIMDLNLIVSKLEEEINCNINASVNVMSSELDELKESLTENLKQIEEYESELEENSATIKHLNSELKRLSNKILETEHSLEAKDKEIAMLNKEKNEKEEVNKKLEKSITDKEQSFHAVCEELKVKCLNLQGQIENNTDSFGPLEIKVQSLEKKNKEQLEKMKKIAANLKKKTLEYKDLEGKHVEVTEKWQNELQEKEKVLATVELSTQQLHEVEAEHTQLIVDFNKKCNEFNELLAKVELMQREHSDLQQKNGELTNHIVSYSAQLEDMQNIIREYENQVGSLSNEIETLRSNANNNSNIELSRKDELINNINEQLESSKVNANALQMKIHELEMYIESQDGDLHRYKDQVFKLEEGLSSVEERRKSLEQQAIRLGAELEEKDMNFEKITQNEDYLEERLKTLAERDAAIENSLKETLSENQNLIGRNQSLLEELDRVKKQLDLAQQKLQDNHDVNNKLEKFEVENNTLQRAVVNLEGELKRVNGELNNLKFDREKNESELQEQLEQYSIERKLLMEQFEVSREQVSSLTQEQEDLKLEISDLTQKLDQQQADFDENIHKYQILEAQHKESLTLVENLNNQLSDLSSVRCTLDGKCAELELSQKTVSELNQQILSIQAELASARSELGLLKQQTDFLESERDRPITSISMQHFSSSQAQPFETPLSNPTNTLFTWPDSSDSSDFIINPSNQDVIDQSFQPHDLNQNFARDFTSSNQNVQSQNFDPNIQPQASNQSIELQDSVPTQSENPFVNNTMEELLNKIKTLQFMLFNAEKERDTALQQSNELSNQVAQLVYERLESQITFDDPTTDQRPVTKVHVEHISTSTEPIEEEPICQKRTFLCYKEEPPKDDIFGDSDDDWAWNAEAKLEQEHMEKVEIQTQNSRVPELEEKIRVFELERGNHLEELKQAQIKSGKLIKKLKEFKLKNEQLSLKLKSDDFGDLNDAIQDELKSQVTTLEKRIKEVSTEMDKEKHDRENLLKRIDVLTAANERMIEMKEKQDIEVLSWQQRNRDLSLKLEQLEWGNDDHTESKSHQPSASIENNSNNPDLLLKVQELNDTIKDLILDNDDLQAMLEEQRNLRLEAEKAKATQVIPENMISEIEYNRVILEKNQMNEEIIQAQNRLKEISQQLDDLTLDNEHLHTMLEEQKNLRLEAENATQVHTENVKSKIEYNQMNEELIQAQNRLKEISQQLQINYSEKTQLEATILENNITIEALNQQLKELSSTINQLKENSAQNIVNDTSLKMRVDSLESEKHNLLVEINSLEKSLNMLKENEIKYVIKIEELNSLQENVQNKVEDELKIKVDLLESEKHNLTTINNNLIVQIKTLQDEVMVFQEKLSALIAEKDQLTAALDELKLVKHSLEEKLADSSNQEKSDELLMLQNTLSTKEAEFQEKISTTVQQLTQEWSGLVDQRGYEIAESWKLHVESRETEFTQVEQQLRKEISEFEEKCNVLVNENNELRRNVDAEIKNEVDRISALQQQINEKQRQIIDLSSALQLKQDEIVDMQVDISNYTRIISELNMKIEEIDVKAQENVLIIQNLKDAKILAEEATSKLQSVLKEREEDLLVKERFIQEMQENMNVLKSSTEKESDNERLINKLQIDIKEKQNDLQESQLLLVDVRNQMEQCKVRISNLEGSLKERDYKINELTEKLQESQVTSSNSLMLHQQIAEYQQQINSFNVQLQENYLYTESLRQELENYKTLTEHVQSKDTEIGRIMNLLQEKEREYEFSLGAKTLEMQSVINDQTQEIDILKRKLEESHIHHSESDNANKVMEEFYKNQIDEFVNMHKTQEGEFIYSLQQELASRDAKYLELEDVVQDDEKQLLELKGIIEEQVIKIEEQKKELYEKSSNYDALIAELNIPQELHKTTNVSEQRVVRHDQEDLAEPVSRAELDLALYMLHQRDVRCEELTVELMQLLEERDTLQLRLSNAIREKEEIKLMVDKSDSDIVEPDISKRVAPPTGAIPKSKAIILGATGTELAAEATEQLTEGSLANKLSELKSVGYRKDKTLVDEQALRRIQQLSILQEHKDEVSKLPPEAAARLVDASYTLSRDVQSPSKVLLNWLWGRSTPKVNNV